MGWLQIRDVGVAPWPLLRDRVVAMGVRVKPWEAM